MPTQRLRNEHDRILRQASAIAGLARVRMTRDVAEEARTVIFGLDRLLVEHLTTEDQWMYPLLMEADDAGVRRVAAACFEDMGGIHGAWNAYRDQWSAEAILADPRRFRAGTDGLIGALALRMERENVELYPLVDRVIQAGGDFGRAA